MTDGIIVRHYMGRRIMIRRLDKYIL